LLQNRDVELVIFDVFRDGHRRDYFRVLRRVLGGFVVSGPLLQRLPVLLRARKLVCSTCDDYLSGFFLLSICRALLGRATLGLSIRTETIFQRSGYAQQVKRSMFKFLKFVPNVNVITFMPHWAEPRLAAYTGDWMYDPQYWDLPWLSAPRPGALATVFDEVRKVAGRRPVVASLGHQRRVKGVEYFMELYQPAEMRERFCFACIGPIWDVDRTLVARFRQAGGVFIDRQLRDDEILPIYALADVVWTCYRPDYDQSSGIFGRAIQLGKPTIVRNQSYLAVLQAGLGTPGYAVPYADLPAAVAALKSMTVPSMAQEHVGADRSTALLFRHVGLSTKARPMRRKRRASP
jgi:hypothetical protein